MYLTQMPTASPDGQEPGEGGVGGDEESDDSDGEGSFGTSAPTWAPSPYDPGNSGDAGLALGTPAPTNHEEDLWTWWFQTGGPRTDRAQALAIGSGGNTDRRFLVGTEDGVVSTGTSAAAASSETKCLGLFCFVLTCALGFFPFSFLSVFRCSIL